jgi:hypothetical protein
LQEIGGFPVGIKSGEDLLTWARVAVRTDWAYSVREMAQYNFDQVSIKEPPTRIPEEIDVVGAELKSMLRRCPNKIGMRKYLCLWHKMRSSMYMRLGYRKECAVEAVKALRYNPWNYKLYAYLVLNMLCVYKRQK